jgi:hypothetical protein
MTVHLVGLIYGSNFSFSDTNVLDMVIEIYPQTLSRNYETEKVIPRTKRNITSFETR